MTLAQHYAQALFDSGKEKDAVFAKRLVESLVALLERRGHRSLLSAITREYRQLALRGDAKQTRVVLAREKDVRAFQDEIEKELAAVGATGTPRREYDETLIGGYRIESGDRVIDASYKMQLLNMYKKMLAT